MYVSLYVWYRSDDDYVVKKKIFCSHGTSPKNFRYYPKILPVCPNRAVEKKRKKNMGEEQKLEEVEYRILNFRRDLPKTRSFAPPALIMLLLSIFLLNRVSFLLLSQSLQIIITIKLYWCKYSYY
jgi:hypothetical protein